MTFPKHLPYASCWAPSRPWHCRYFSLLLQRTNSTLQKQKLTVVSDELKFNCFKLRKSRLRDADTSGHLGISCKFWTRSLFWPMSFLCLRQLILHCYEPKDSRELCALGKNSCPASNTSSLPSTWCLGDHPALPRGLFTPGSAPSTPRPPRIHPSVCFPTWLCTSPQARPPPPQPFQTALSSESFLHCLALSNRNLKASSPL